jgi:hypothetical protein
MPAEFRGEVLSATQRGETRVRLLTARDRKTLTRRPRHACGGLRQAAAAPTGGLSMTIRVGSVRRVDHFVSERRVPLTSATTGRGVVCLRIERVWAHEQLGHL